jgi:2-keto-4-pentenoate hydratase/2-oxohepta-3-ene-1,7-dioic acid hydratase in catechol pathway
MRLANLASRLAIVHDGAAIDVEGASQARFSSDPQAVYEDWEAFRAWAPSAPGPAQPFDPAELGPPVPRPRQVFAVGLNYAMHAKEAGLELPPMPLTFTKFPSCIVGDRAVVEVATERVDWEVELVAVIGRRTHRVPVERAWDHVAGLTIGQDISARDVQMTGSPPQFSLGKSFPGFGPTGPWLVTPDELADRDDLEIGCTVNGEQMQSDRTSSMLFSIPELIARMSAICPLLPGDLLFTGTPAGVGNRMDPPRYLKSGDVLVSTAEGIGSLTTTFVERSGPSD